MNQFSRIVLGFHGCVPQYGDALIGGEVSIADWKFSENPYDWLGHGIYFWEFGPQRAKAWALKAVSSVP